ncbi:MAG: S-layer homology domain-containing protein [Oscillospiraceae bacterium]|nr:S-layer homology domain-containing protein [Oscillospiraceae bacterium]
MTNKKLAGRLLAMALCLAMVCGMFAAIPVTAQAAETKLAKDYESFVSEVADLMMSDRMETHEGMAELLCMVESDDGIALAEALNKDAYVDSRESWVHRGTFYFEDFTVAIKTGSLPTDYEYTTTNPNLKGKYIRDIYVFTGDPNSYYYTDGSQPVYRKVASLGQNGYSGTTYDDTGKTVAGLTYQFCAAEYVESEDYPNGSPMGKIVYHDQDRSYQVNQADDFYSMIVGTTEGLIKDEENRVSNRANITGSGIRSFLFLRDRTISRESVTSLEAYNIPSMPLIRGAIGPDVHDETISDWARTEVDYMRGVLPTSMKKNYREPVSRGNFAQLIISQIESLSSYDGTEKRIDDILLEKGLSINADVFSDTDDKAVLAANALGIIQGVGDGKFNPDGSLTRAQAAAIVNRIAKLFGIDTDGYTHSFTDVSGHWVDAELGWPVQNGIILGVGDNRFSPDTELTTEQAIVIMYRSMQPIYRFLSEKYGFGAGG